jgi:serine/threonine-protein kinase
MPGAQPAPDLPLGGGDADPLLGRVLNDRYRIVEVIGHGGMGRVYKAVQAPLDRLVALKVLGAGHDRDPSFYKRFFLEASVTAKLTHPNTITLYDYGRTDDGVLFIAMEFLGGRTLSQTMQAEGPLSQERAIHVAQQICRSLREAHALGIIHRDLKPANVMLLLQHDDHDFVKVLDFGLVKFFSGDNGEGDITNAGTFMGSPHYIAPEQARNQGPDQRCDIYSLGVLLYHMLTGRVPFTAAAPVDIILKHLHEEPVPPASLRPDLRIAPDVEQIVLRCMAKAREDRFQSMDELLVQLKAARARLTGISAPSSVPPVPMDGLGRAASAAQTPPTPQPALRMTSQPLNPSRPTPAQGVGHVARPPPPPPDAMVDEYPVPRPTPRPQAAATPLPPKRTPSALRVFLPSALILVAGIAAVAFVLRSGARRTPAAQAETSVAPPAPALQAVAPPPVAPQPAQAATATPPQAEAPPNPVPVTEVQPAPPPTTLVTLTSTPPGALVFDGSNRPLGVTPFEVRMTPGKQLQVGVRLRGYRTAWVDRKVEGEKMSVNVAMKVLTLNKRSIGYKEDPY